MSGDLSGFSLMELFRMEAESHTTMLSAGLVALEGASAGPDVIEPLMRAAHSLKGAEASSVSRPPYELRTHWKTVGNRTAREARVAARTIDILLKGVDLLVRIAHIDEPDIAAWQSAHAAEIDALTAELAAVKEGRAPHQERPASSGRETTSAPPTLVVAEPGLFVYPSPEASQAAAGR